MGYTNYFANYDIVQAPSKQYNIKLIDTPSLNEFDYYQRPFQSKKEETPTQKQEPMEFTSVLDVPILKEPTKVAIDTKIDIEDLFRKEGLLSINGKQIKFGSRKPRSQNASFGAKNSWHKKADPYTGYAMARDISIMGGLDEDYAEFRKQILANNAIRNYLIQKNWGIINEITPEILAITRGTGRHFHFGPDQWALRTWKAWLDNPEHPITKSFRV